MYSLASLKPGPEMMTMIWSDLRFRAALAPATCSLVCMREGLAGAMDQPL